MTYRRPELLHKRHDTNGFECRSSEQTRWLHNHALQANSAGTSKVFVVTGQDSQAVAAYYAWTMSSLTTDQAPERLRKGAGRYPQPVALLARLGVDTRHEGKGLGAGLLKDVIARTADLSTQIGCRALLVHAETNNARDFYLHLTPEFETSPTDPLHLVLLTKDIRKSLT